MYCKTYKATIAERTCLLRYSQVKDYDPHLNTGTLGARTYPQFGGCRKCVTGKNIYERDQKGEPIMESTIDRAKEKTCSKCKQIKALSDFGGNKRAPDGKQYWCKTCTRKAHQKRYRKKRENQNPDPSNHVPEGQKLEKQEPGQERVELVLDFSHHQELFEDIKVVAGQEFRTPEMQAMYYLNNIKTAQEI